MAGVVDRGFLRGYITASLNDTAVERVRGVVLAAQIEVANVLLAKVF